MLFRSTGYNPATNEITEPCTFPRSARRKFRKEWRAAVRSLTRQGIMTPSRAAEYRKLNEAGLPSSTARTRRRMIVTDSMIRRGEALSEQASSGGVDSEGKGEIE